MTGAELRYCVEVVKLIGLAATEHGDKRAQLERHVQTMARRVERCREATVRAEDALYEAKHEAKCSLRTRFAPHHGMAST